MKYLLPTLLAAAAAASFFVVVPAYAQDSSSALGGIVLNAIAGSTDVDVGAGAIAGRTVRHGHKVQPTTTPTLRYSWTHHSVQITGVLIAEGKPLAHGKVNILVVLGGDFAHWQPVESDGNGAYVTTIKAPSRIASVSVNAPSFCSTGDDSDCYTSYSIALGETDARAVGSLTVGTSSGGIGDVP